MGDATLVDERLVALASLGHVGDVDAVSLFDGGFVSASVELAGVALVAIAGLVERDGAAGALAAAVGIVVGPTLVDDQNRCQCRSVRSTARC